MNAKFLVTAAILGGITLFLWGAVSHAVLPQPLREFKDPKAAVEFVKAQAPENGVYLAGEGIFLAVSARPDYSDKTTNLAPNLLTQLVTDMAAALFLGVLLLNLRCTTAGQRAGVVLAAALASAFSQNLPGWNWYGFSTTFTLQEVADVVLGWGC